MISPRVLAVVGMMVLLPLAWLLAAPQQLGGSVAVVTTYGDSMLPTYTASDLVVVAEQANYDIGDVVAYRSREMGAVVLHRIVDEDDDGYVTQGDNNEWLDPDRPTDDELMGTARLRVPGVGRLLELPGPLRAAGVTALAALALFGAKRGGRRERGRRRGVKRRPVGLSGSGSGAAGDPLSERGTNMPQDDETSGTSLTWAGWPATVTAVGAVGVFVAAALGLAAFTSPATVDGEQSVTHRGTFDYTTRAPAGLVYPEGEVTTGEPVFLRLVDTLDVQFTHELEGGEDNSQVTGRLWLELADDAGWSHRTPLSDEQQATEEPLVLEAVLDIPDVRELIEEIRKEAGLASSGGGRIDVTAEVEVAGSTSEADLAERFSPTLSFSLEEQRLVPRTDEGEGFTTTEEGTIAVEDGEAARLEFAGRGLAVSDARTLAAVLLLLGVLLAAAGVAGAWRHRGRSEAELVDMRYRSKMIDVASLQPPPGHGLVTVRDMAALNSLADLAERPILHHQDGDLHTYVVEDETTQYRYHLRDREPNGSEDGTGPADDFSKPVEAKTKQADSRASDEPTDAPEDPDLFPAVPPRGPALPVPPPPPSHGHRAWPSTAPPSPTEEPDYETMADLFDANVPADSADRGHSSAEVHDDDAHAPGQRDESEHRTHDSTDESDEQTDSAESPARPLRAKPSSSYFGRSPWSARG